MKKSVWARGTSVALTLTTSMWLAGATLIMPLSVSADLISDLQAQIAALTAQLAALSAAQSGGAAMTSSCSFTRDLTVGSRGDDVTCLQNALKSEGHLVYSGALGYFGGLTKAAVAKWQAAKGITPAAGYFGAKSRAAFTGSMTGGTTGGTTGTTGGTTTTVPSGSGLTVSAGVQPAEALVPYSAARVPFTKVVFTASADGDVTVNSITVQRTGIGSDSGLAGVVLLDENGTQLGIAQTLNSNHQANLTEKFVVKAGTSRTMTIGGNRAGSSVSVAGEIVRLAVVSVDAGAAKVNGSLPITGNGMTMNTSLAIGDITMARGPLDPNSAQSKQVGTTGFVFSSVRMTAGSAEKVYLNSIRWNQTGSAATSDLANVMTYVEGTAYPVTVSSDGKYYTSVFTGGILVDKGLSKEILIKGDVVGGSGRTVKMDVYRNTDLNVAGETYGFGISPATSGTAGLFGTTNPWYAGSTMTVSNGNISVAKSSTVASQNVAINVPGQVLGGFDVTVQGEAVSVAQMVYRFSRGVGSGAAATQDLTNISLYDQNGKVVAGPADVSTTVAGTQATLTFSNTVTFPIGTGTYTLKGKIGTDFASNDTIAASTTPSSDWTTVTGQVTGNTITPSPTSAVTANTMTVKAATVAVSVSATPIAQTVVSGGSKFVFANYQFDGTASGEDVRFGSVGLEYLAANGSTATNLTNCQLFDGSTSITTGGNLINPTASASSTTFTIDGAGLIIPKGTVKTIALKCDIAGGATGSYAWGINSTPTGTGQTSGQSATVTKTASAGQLMTLTAGGSLTVTSDASSPSYAIVSAGTSGNIVGVLKLHASSEVINLQKIALQMSNSSASSSPSNLTQVTLWDGATQVGTAVFTGSSRNATSTLSGTFSIPKDSDKLLTIKADLAGIGTSLAGTQGALIQVDYDGSDPTGTQGTGQSSGTTINHGSTSDTSFAGVRVFKSYPTVARLAIPSTTLITATGVDLYRFSVTANSAGAVGLAQITVNIATSSTPSGTSSSTVTNLKVVAYTDSGFSSPVSGFTTAGQLNTTITGLVSSGNTVIGGAAGFNGSSAGSADGYHLQIPAGSTYYFRVLGDTTLTGSVTSGSVVTKVQGDSAYPTLSGLTDTTTVVNGAAGGSGLFIWSANATSTSGLGTQDWANGYFIQGLPSTGMDNVTISK